MKRRISTIILSLLLLLALTACGSPEGDGSYVFLPTVSSDHIVAVIPDSGNVSQNDPEGDNFVDPNETEGDGIVNPDETEGNGDVNQNLPEGNEPGGKSDEGNTVAEDGWYTSKEEVALYIHLYGELPGNYVTKKEAEDAGWSGGNVERWTGEGTAIGGSRFGNYEGLLPKEKGRTYTECDIDTPGKNSRGAKRIVFSNDGLIYYTGDHYETFELLYGEP